MAGSNHWERKMNPPRKKSTRPRKPAREITDLKLQAFDLVLEGASVSEAIRTTGLYWNSIGLPGWSTEETAEYNKTYKDRVKAGLAN